MSEVPLKPKGKRNCLYLLATSGSIGFQVQLGKRWFLGKYIVSDYDTSICEFAKPYLLDVHGISYDATSLKQAYFWFNKAASSGNALAKYLLATCYLHGLGVKQDIKLATNLMVQAALQQNPYAILTFSNKDFRMLWTKHLLNNISDTKWKRGNDFDSVVRRALKTVYEQARIVKQNPFASYVLGCCYQNGNYVTKDKHLSSQYFHQSAGGGHVLARVAAKDRKLLEDAANQGYPLAQTFCGALLQQSGQRDHLHGVKWLLLAAMQNQPHAYYYLGKAMLGNTATWEGASKFFAQGMDLGNVGCLAGLGSMYLEGKFVEKDEMKGVELLQLAADRGDQQACHDLGTWYYQSTKKWELALKYLERANLHFKNDLVHDWLNRLDKIVRTWSVIKVLWMGWYKNRDTPECYIWTLPKEVLRDVIVWWRIAEPPPRNRPPLVKQKPPELLDIQRILDTVMLCH